MTTPPDQIAQLEAAIAAQESLRATLGDAVVDITVNALRAQIDALQAEQQPASQAATSPEELLARLQQHLPPELAAKIRATGRIEGERKQVTVLFADLSGFTALSERLDPEEVASLTHEALKELAEAVYQHEGYIDKFIGDCVMAVFGAPIAHEDDPDRALRAALAMREQLQGFNRRWAERLAEPLELHVGINTGPVIAGNIGSDLRLSYTVMGDTVNTASRLESAAVPGQILVSHDTYRLAQAAFLFEALEPIRVKGKREPLAVFELRRARLIPGTARGLQGLGAAFVGREPELAALRAVSDDLNAGRGGVVTIAGEAGIGKSRLMSEWHAEIGEHVRWLEGRAFLHTGALAYGPFLDLFRRTAGIRDEDSEATARARLDAQLDRLFPDDVEARAIFAHLLGMRVSLEEAELLMFLPGDTLRRRLFARVEAIFTRLAAAQPAILVIEDMHWADTSTIELVEHLVPLIERVPLAIVGVFRGAESAAAFEDALPEGCLDPLTRVRLAPLLEDASQEMVEQLLDTTELPPRLRELIVEKAEGNPFFVEEVIRSLIDRGALMLAESGRGWVATSLAESVTVPDTLQGLLMSRLDRLPDEVRWLVQQASVIGRIFHFPVLRRLAERGEDLEADLDQLQREELIRERARDPEVEYIFKHGLTQEVAYGSLLAARRRDLHRRIGEAIEDVFSERVNELRGIVGQHLLKGEAWSSAAGHLMAAGDAAARLYAHDEARSYYAGVLEALGHLPDDHATRRRRIDAIIKQVSVSILVEDPENNLARLAEAEDLTRVPSDDNGSTEDRLRVARINYWFGRTHYYRNDLTHAIERFQQVLQLARELGDDELLATPSTLVGRVMLLRGRFGEARRLLGQAAPLLDKLGDWYEWTATVGFYGMALSACGEYYQGVEQGEQALARARESGNRTGITLSHIFLAYSHHFGSNMVRMREEANAALEAAEQSGERLYLYLALAFRGWVESRLGEHALALSSIEQAKMVYDSLGGQLLFADGFAAIRAEVALNSGRAEEAAFLAEEAVGVGRAFGGLLGEGIAQRVWAEALAALDSTSREDVEEHLMASLKACEAGEARLEAAWTHLAWGRVAHARGEHATAENHLQQAIAQFEASRLPDASAQTQTLLRAIQVRP